MGRVRNALVEADDLLERPLRPRSVIGSLLLGVHPPRLPAARIVDWCTRFGIAEGTTRVALSRMVERGELRSDGGVYELAGRVRELQPAQDWSLAPELPAWDGSWRLGLVVAPARDARARTELRDAMRRLRCAEPREGCWTRPANLPREAAPAAAWAVAEQQCQWWTATPEGDPQQLAAELFSPATWAARARMLGERLAGACTALRAGDDAALAPGFVVGAAALQHARRDPLLPAELLPGSWPGADLRAGYRDFQQAFSTTLSETLRR